MNDLHQSRRGTAARGEAAHFVLGLTGTRRAQRYARHLADQILHRHDVLLGQIGGTQGRNADRRCLDRRFALLGGDDDLLEPCVILGRRIAGRGRECGPAEGRGAQ